MLPGTQMSIYLIYTCNNPYKQIRQLKDNTFFPAAKRPPGIGGGVETKFENYGMGYLEVR